MKRRGPAVDWIENGKENDPRVTAGLGWTLADLRKRARMSQQDLADASDVSRGTIRNIEGGKVRPMPATLELLAKGMAKDPDGVVDDQHAANLLEKLLSVGYFKGRHPGSPPPETFEPGESPQERADDVLARHPEIKVAFAQFDDLDDDDAEMIVQVVEYVARKGAEKRQRARDS